jgi:hypothetical protein
MTGYSGTPLLKKLGIKPAMTFYVMGAPPEYEHWLGPLPEGAAITHKPAKANIEAAHLFFDERFKLHVALESLRNRLSQTGFIWISWPKKASKVPTDITEDVIREIALPMGYVDIKVCAVSDIWSGLKLVIRKSERTA